MAEEEGKIMPAGFDRCRANDGRIRTEKVGKTKYRHVCWLGSKRYPGEVKTKQSHTKALKKRMG